MATKYCRVAIIGASFAGLSAFLSLRKRLGKDADIVLFDKRTHFTHIPSLHMCLGRPQKLQQIQIDLRTHYAQHFQQAEITDITHQHTITSADGQEWRADYIIIATGSLPKFFDNESRKTHGHTFRRAEDITHIHADIPAAQQISVIGGGIAGVELASTLKEQWPSKHIRLIESNSTVLSMMGNYTSKTAMRYLHKQDIELICGTRLTDVAPTTITLNDGRTLPSDMTLITSGVTANATAHTPHIHFDNIYTSGADKTIYLAGDVAMDGLLPTAHNAFFEGRRMGHLVADDILGLKRSYPPLRNWTNLAIALGKYDGIMTFGKWGIYLPWFTGFAKWLVERKVLFELKYKIMLPI